MDIDAPTDASTESGNLVSPAPPSEEDTDARVPADTDARSLPDDDRDTDAPEHSADQGTDQPASPL